MHQIEINEIQSLMDNRLNRIRQPYRVWKWTTALALALALVFLLDHSWFILMGLALAAYIPQSLCNSAVEMAQVTAEDLDSLVELNAHLEPDWINTAYTLRDRGYLWVSELRTFRDAVADRRYRNCVLSTPSAKALLSPLSA